MPQALSVPDDSQLMSYLGQSTLRMECVHREKEGRGEGGVTKHLKKSLIWLVIQQMLQIWRRASRCRLGISKH